MLDPFCGGGSIPLEAQRLGFLAIAADLNPVAALITKALIETPIRFPEKPLLTPRHKSRDTSNLVVGRARKVLQKTCGITVGGLGMRL